jgi:hypothetical protein
MTCGTAECSEDKQGDEGESFKTAKMRQCKIFHTIPHKFIEPGRLQLALQKNLADYLVWYKYVQPFEIAICRYFLARVTAGVSDCSANPVLESAIYG